MYSIHNSKNKQTKPPKNHLGFWKYFAKYFSSFFFFHYLWTEEQNCASVAKQIMQNYTAWLFYIPEPWSKDFQWLYVCINLCHTQMNSTTDMFPVLLFYFFFFLCICDWLLITTSQEFYCMKENGSYCSQPSFCYYIRQGSYSLLNSELI